MTTTWDYDGYWDVVLGAGRSAEDVVREFELDTTDSRGLDEWLGTAEAAAWQEGKLGGPIPEAWASHHVSALAELEGSDREESYY
jgi:hypothetical protein